ncbi:MAG: UDP-3-O-(3-hydroxymyristoyl)glucosamine N-acyltransferase [Nitrospirae bacterium]|nr:UDP-3-O-(3-hydroxymyristoyl)glucosamine N-acyltransferase [Nitrospirota bacterium]
MGGRTLGELAGHVGGRVVGNAALVVSGVAPLETAGPDELSFIANPKYRRHAAASRAGALVVDSAQGLEGRNAIISANPYLAVAKILALLHPPRTRSIGISGLACVHPSATVAEDVSIAPFVYVGAKSRVGSRTVLSPCVFVGEGAEIGRECTLHPGVVVMDGCRVGDRVILHPGVVVGSDGFGYAQDGGRSFKVPQVGMAEIGEDVEIGANTTVDRGSVGVTRLGRGVKIDNLVQIGHNVEVGEDSILVAQVGISGSTKLGRGVQVGGQAGFAGHIHVGDGARVAGQAGVISDVEGGATVGGTPHQRHGVWIKSVALAARLPEFLKAFRDLQDRVAALETARAAPPSVRPARAPVRRRSKRRRS